MQGYNNKVILERGRFYPLEAGKWDEGWQNWMNSDIMVIRGDVSGAITLKLVFRDNYNRCRDVVVEMDSDKNLISSVASDYYLWPH